MDLMIKAPKQGLLYAILTDKVLFERYNEDQLSEFQVRFDMNPDLLELHMFNSEKEYRFIKSAGRGDIEAVITDETANHSDFYEENVYIAKDFVTKDDKSVGIVNYILFDDDDLLHITNYRLKALKEEATP